MFLHPESDANASQNLLSVSRQQKLFLSLTRSDLSGLSARDDDEVSVASSETFRAEIAQQVRQTRKHLNDQNSRNPQSSAQNERATSELLNVDSY
jgi:hypothetical protein